VDGLNGLDLVDTGFNGWKLAAPKAGACRAEAEGEGGARHAEAEGEGGLRRFAAPR